MKKLPITRTKYNPDGTVNTVDTLVWYKGNYVPVKDVPAREVKKTRGKSKFKVNASFFASIAHKLDAKEFTKLLGTISFI